MLKRSELALPLTQPFRREHPPGKLPEILFLGILSFRKPLEPMPVPLEEALPPAGQHCPMRGNCRPSSCLGLVGLLRRPWPAKSRKEARVFPLLQPAAIVEKVNTPLSLTSKSSSQEWKEIKSLFQPPAQPQRVHKGWSVLLGQLWERRNKAQF